MKKFYKTKKFFSSNFIKIFLLIIFVGGLAYYGIVNAGVLTAPSGVPSASFYTLSDVYDRLTTNTVATEGGHSFSFDDALSPSGHTLSDIYEAIPTINPGKLLNDTTYLGITGTIHYKSLSNSSLNVEQGYYDTATTLDTIDTDLITGNIKSGVNLFGINGTLLPSGGDTMPSDVLTGKTFFGASQGDWVLQTGTMANNGNFSLTPSSSDQEVAIGYYSGGTLVGDVDLTASNIKSGVNIFGIDGTLSSGYTYGDDNADYVLGTASSAGTALSNVFNGSSTSLDYPQSTGGVDDYNSGGSRPSNSYSKSWTTCDSSNNYCGTGDSVNAEKEDNSTGLVWSKLLESGATKSWFWANNCKYPNGLTGDDGVCDANGEVACKCVKLTGTGEGGNGAQTGCDALGSGWRLPYQKELMLAYIDGSWGNLSAAGSYYWSATTVSTYTQYAWITYLSPGNTLNVTKTTAGGSRVRCVR